MLRAIMESLRTCDFTRVFKAKRMCGLTQLKRRDIAAEQGARRQLQLDCDAAGALASSLSACRRRARG